MKRKTVLIIEDDQRTSHFLVLVLEKAGYNTLTAFNGTNGLSLIENSEPDLVLLDIVMPEMNGWEVLRRLRKFSEVPVIILTAEDSKDTDKIKGLNSGADDYIIKPFNPAELAARIETILRRYNGNNVISKSVVIAGNLTFDLVKMTVSREDTTVKFTKLENDLIKIFINNSGRVIVYDEIMKNIWGMEFRNDLQLLRNAVFNVRKKIKKLSPEDTGLIKNVPRIGYDIRLP